MNSSTTVTCAHCGGPVSTKGRASKSGKRFCSSSGCQAAKVRLRRQSLAVEREAPTACFGCRAALPSRRWRAGDEHGRWCQKAACQVKRRQISEKIREDVDATRRAELLENAVTLLSEALLADNEHILSATRKICRDCGLSDALSGWPHFTAEGAACMGTLDGKPARKIQAFHLGLAWPAVREYLTPDQLETLDD